MNVTIEVLAENVIGSLLEHRGFENFWYDLEDDAQEEIRESLEETIKEWLDEEDE
jgi:hypothetical protein